MANNYCIFCKHCDKASANADKEMDCKLLNIKVTALRCCPGWKPIEYTPEEQAKIAAKREQLLAMSNNKPAQTKPVAAKPKISKSVKTETEPVETDYAEEEKQVKLFEHQKLARNKFKDLDEIALFFEMGCGKSVTSLSIMIDKYKEGKIDSLLIVAPNDVHKQWFDDLCNDDALLSRILEQEHVPCTGQIIGGRGGQKQFYDFEDDGKLHIVCVNIDTFSQPHKWEVIVDWVNKNKTAIIIDEATSIKNPNSKRSQRMLYEFNDVMKKRNTVLFSGKKPNTSVRCVLTGTPVSNGPMDLWSIMEFIKPNYFGRNYYSFMNYYGMHTKLKLDTGQQISVLLTEKTWNGIKGCKDYSEAFNTFGCSEDTYMTVMHQDHYIGPYKHADELKQLLEPVAVFAKLTDCVDMPPVHYITKEVPLSDAQKACYNDMKHDLLAIYDDNVATAKNKLVVTLRLQQIASGFIMGHKEIDPEDLDLPCWSDVEAADEYDVTPDEVIWLGDTNPKLEQLKRDVAELDKPLLILTRFSAEAAKIYDLLKDDYSCMLFTGWKTTGSIEKFKAGEFQIMVANTTKIARGFNLQIAHTTIYYSNTFSMELRQQSEFRTFRMGQKYPCTYIDYVSCEVDKTIADALRLKKGLLEYIRDKNIEEVI